MRIDAIQEDYYSALKDKKDGEDVTEDDIIARIGLDLNTALEEYNIENIREAEHSIGRALAAVLALYEVQGKNSIVEFDKRKVQDFQGNGEQLDEASSFVVSYNAFTSLVSVLKVEELRDDERINDCVKRFILSLSQVCENTKMNSLNNCVMEVLE